MTLRLLVIITLSSPGIARADSIVVAHVGRGEAVSGTGGGEVRPWGGELTWTCSGGRPDFYSYCIDLMNNELNHQAADLGATGAMLTDNMVTTAYAARNAAWLFTTDAALAQGSGAEGMALGLPPAIWEALLETSGSHTAGSLGGLAHRGEKYYPSWPDTHRGSGQEPLTTPEPGTLLLLGTGLAGLSARRRKKTRA
jgi:hypothetical protein